MMNEYPPNDTQANNTGPAGGLLAACAELEQAFTELQTAYRDLSDACERLRLAVTKQPPVLVLRG